MYSKNSEFKKFFFKSNQKILDFDKIWIEKKIRIVRKFNKKSYGLGKIQNVRKFWNNSHRLNKKSERKKIQLKIVWIRKNSKCKKMFLESD